MPKKNLKSTVLLLCLFTFTTPLFSFSRNWNPFPDGQVYLYSFQTTQSPDTYLHGIRTVMISTSGADTIYHFNKINRYLRDGEVVNNCAQSPLNGLEHVLLERENFFGERMLLRANGIFDFVTTGSDTFSIQTQAPVGSSWLFTNGVSATLDSIRVANVLGVMDSVQYISLTNGHHLHLSQNHGFVRAFSFLTFPIYGGPDETVDYALWGIPHLNLGASIPGPKEVFDHEVGDHFGYSWRQWGTINSPSYEDLTSKIITGKTSTANSYDYQAQGDRLAIVNSSYSAPDSTYHGLFQFSENVMLADYGFLNLLPYESDSGLVQFGIYLSSQWNNRIVHNLQEILNYEPCANALFFDEELREFRYGEGLGEIYNADASLFGGEIIALTCYEKRQDFVGPCPDLSILLSMEDRLAESFSWSVSPQPAQDFLQIQLGHSLPNGQLTLYTAEGRRIQEQELSHAPSAWTLDTSPLPSGLYYLRLESPDQAPSTKKITINH